MSKRHGLRGGLSRSLTLVPVRVLCVAPGFPTTAAEHRIDPHPFAVAASASASLSTPISYQTNTMPHGIDGCRYNDFVRLGAPLAALLLVATVVLVPLLWPWGP